MISSTRPFIFALLILIAFVCSARADDSVKLLSLDAPKYPTTFEDQKRWDVEVLGTVLGDVTNRGVIMGGVTAGAGYYVFPNLAIQLDLSGYGFGEASTDGAAVGITIGLRHHILQIGKSSLFCDVSFGEMEASNDLPPRGTHRNNTFEFGLGMSYPIGENVYLIGGPRYFHLSNANDAGRDRNPSINAIQGVFGIMWKF